MSQSAFAPRSRYLRDILHNEESPENESMRRSPSTNDSIMDTFGSKKEVPRGDGVSSFAMSQAGSGGKLAQEIHDEFLVCKICLEQYKNPKCLNCLHTFCEQCIENHVQSESTYKKYSDYREFTCPLCRKRTQLPIGGVKKLPDNFLIGSLSEVIVRQRPSKFPFCDLCKVVNKRHKEAESKCLDCNKLLCKSCVEMHKETKVTKNHNIFDVDIEKDVECKEHPEEVVRFYCEPCETCICVLCTFNEHKDHEISQFGEAVEKYKETIQNLVKDCREKINKFDDQLEALTKCESIMKEAEQKIHDAAIQFIADIRNREKLLISELQNIYGNECTESVNTKNEMAVTIETLRNTCNLTEVILKGKDIELLLLRKDVSEKLSALSSFDVKSLPGTISKVVNFIPGTVDVGFIQDMDRPLLSNMRAKRPIRGSHELYDYPDPPEMVSEETQTAPEESASEYETSSESESESDSDDEDEPDTKPKRHRTPSASMRDQSTETDPIVTEDKAVNTRSRSMTALSNQLRRSPPKDGYPDVDKDGGQVVDPAAYRRQRRRYRERPHTMDMQDVKNEYALEDGYVPSRTMSVDFDAPDGQSLGERRRYRHRLTYGGGSLDNGLDDESFYSADNSPATSSPL